MSRIKYVHVIEYESGRRLLSHGKGDRSGTNVAIPTPENDRDDFERMDWERVDYWQLPETMTKAEFKDWWNDHKDDDPKPAPIPEVLAAMEAGEGGDER